MFAIHPIIFLSQCMTFSWNPGMCNAKYRQLWHGMWYPPWRQCWSSVQSLDIKRQWSQPHSNRPWVRRSSICFWDPPPVRLDYDATVLPNLNLGWASGFCNIQKCERGMERVAIVENLRRGNNVFLWCSWNLESLSAIIYFLDRLVSIFTGHLLGTISQSTHTSSCYHSHNAWCRQGKPETIFHIVGRSEFLPKRFVCWTYKPCLWVPTLALHIVSLMACSAPYRLTKLDGNLAMCHLEARQPNSNTDVVWATLGYAELIDSSLWWQVAWVLGQWMK